GGTASLTYAYDAANRLSQITQGTLQWTFAYDGAGNRTQLTQPNGTSTIYAYLSNNWLSSITHKAPGGAAFQTISYLLYDANGNLIGTSAGQSFSYDEFNRMVHAVGNTVGYTYNGDGLKVQRAGPDGTTRYYYDGFRPIWETDGAGAMTAQLDRDIFGNLLS